MRRACPFADTCLAKETLQRSKGDAKQSTLQRFASKADSSSGARKQATRRQLSRSATAADSVSSTTGQAKRQPRRASSDSAVLLHADTPPQPALPLSSYGSQDDEEPLPNKRTLKPLATPVTHPITEAAVAAALRTVNGPVSGSDVPESTAAWQRHTASPAGCVHVQTSVVGRRFRTGITCSKHTQVSLVRQPDNARDSNAIQVVDTARQAILGYLPREISEHLAGLLDADSVSVTATVDEPKSIAAPVPVLLEVSSLDSVDSGAQTPLLHKPVNATLAFAIACMQ